ncbi:prepilin peptidase [Parahaliea mediterranea]|uniref:Prepilin leader peptidase/N-methyltransferase n=1 Tax=Parahaliea mediterranea TaxID=651086 RepID=A0A939IIL8_9GAMM|nr:A24 family peptidase [Parahaliea mediterranea]MBN7795391.1 prepilin peptidase [Parahaliea mediterranea]
MLELFSQHGWLLPLFLLALGLVVGSFLNVVIYRLPLMMEASWRAECAVLLEVDDATERPRLSLAVPNSHCPHCKAPVRPWQNIPVISYLALRGKCASCGAGISPRYPLVELATGLASLFLAIHFGASPALAGALLFTWALIALTMIDIDHQLLPDNITLPLLWLGLLFNLAGTFAPLRDAVIGAIAGYLCLWTVYWVFKLLTGKEGMGYGDFKLLAALGAWMGWQALPMIVLLSSLVGAVVGIALMVIRRRGREVPIPFGPYLAMAGWLALVWGDSIMASYLGATGLQ